MADWRNLPNWLGFASWRALSVAAGLSLVPAERALAVDLPPAPILPPISAASEAFTGWLLRGDIGAGFEIRPDIGAAENPIAPGVLLSPHAVSSFGDATLSPSGMIDGGVGYVFTPWLRMDSTLEYRFGGRLQSGYAISDPAPLGLAGPFRSWERLSAGVSSIVALVNGYVDLGSYWGATPFVGAGIGVADNALSSVYDQGFAVSGGGAPVSLPAGRLGNRRWHHCSGGHGNVCSRLVGNTEACPSSGKRDLGGCAASNRLAFFMGASVGLLALAAHSVVDFNLHIPANAILGVTLLALLTSNLRFATERYWLNARLPVRLLATVALAGVVVFLGWQGWRRGVENYRLARAQTPSLLALDRAALLEKAFAAEPDNF